METARRRGDHRGRSRHPRGALDPRARPGLHLPRLPLPGAAPGPQPDHRAAHYAARAQAAGQGGMKLARSRVLVATIACAILLVIGALGAMLLGSQAQPTWPFAVRVSGAAFGDPELRAKLLPALWSIAAGLALGGVVIVVGVVVRRLRWYAVPAGLAIAAASVAAFAPVLSVLAVEAFPT